MHQELFTFYFCRSMMMHQLWSFTMMMIMTMLMLMTWWWWCRWWWWWCSDGRIEQGGYSHLGWEHVRAYRLQWLWKWLWRLWKYQYWSTNYLLRIFENINMESLTIFGWVPCSQGGPEGLNTDRTSFSNQGDISWAGEGMLLSALAVSTPMPAEIGAHWAKDKVFVCIGLLSFFLFCAFDCLFVVFVCLMVFGGDDDDNRQGSHPPDTTEGMSAHKD